ncbi:MAG: SGNH/GDSL hydrolase family protein [Chitinophagaceae bacterium]
MKFVKAILYIIGFFLIGELLVRLDQGVNPFSKDSQVMIAMQIEESSEWKMVKANNVPIDDSTYRIMILGDSYIHGAAISDKSKFATILRENLLKKYSGKYKRVFVLDLSRPANNTLDNYNSYKQFTPVYQPQLIVLAYNLNDVANNLDEQDTTGLKTGELPVKQAAKPGFVKKLYNILYTSHVVQFCMHNLNDYLKSMGIIFPNSVFDQELKSYTQNKPNWIRSKEILDNLVKETSAKDQKIMVIRMPEFDLLDYKNIFEKTNSITKDYFTSHKNIDFIDPELYYSNYKSKELRLNKYDGHPNEKAHAILANGVISFIDSNYLKN